MKHLPVIQDSFGESRYATEEEAARFADDGFGFLPDNTMSVPLPGKSGKCQCGGECSESACGCQGQSQRQERAGFSGTTIRPPTQEECLGWLAACTASCWTLQKKYGWPMKPCMIGCIGTAVGCELYFFYDKITNPGTMPPFGNPNRCNDVSAAGGPANCDLWGGQFCQGDSCTAPWYFMASDPNGRCPQGQCPHAVVQGGGPLGFGVRCLCGPPLPQTACGPCNTPGSVDPP